MGKEHELKGLGSLGKKTPFYRWEKSNRYAHIPHRAVLPLVLKVLPLDLTVLPQMVAVLLFAIGTKKNTSGPTTARLGTSFWSRAVLPLQEPRQYCSGAVVKNYIRSNSRQYRCNLFRTPKLPQLLQTDSEFDETKFVGKLATRANTIFKEISIRGK